MPIEWDALVVEMTLLAAIIYGAIYVENWVEKRKTRREEREMESKIIKFVQNDLRNKLRFIDESLQYKDFKPFFTDMWDAVILGGKQAVLPFEVFQNLQHTYSWMKYYNNELEQRAKGGSRGSDDEKALVEDMEEVRKSISQSLRMLGSAGNNSTNDRGDGGADDRQQQNK